MNSLHDYLNKKESSMVLAKNIADIKHLVSKNNKFYNQFQEEVNFLSQIDEIVDRKINNQLKLSDTYSGIKQLKDFLTINKKANFFDCIEVHNYFESKETAFKASAILPYTACFMLSNLPSLISNLSPIGQTVTKYESALKNLTKTQLELEDCQDHEFVKKTLAPFLKQVKDLEKTNEIKSFLEIKSKANKFLEDNNLTNLMQDVRLSLQEDVNNRKSKKMKR